jgi:hypothetical protein
MKTNFHLISLFCQGKQAFFPSLRPVRLEAQTNKIILSFGFGG